ncbi:variable surface lipoprotein [Mycoplasma sp. ES3225-GEN-MYC]|uniref:variable surface lipoprotein n=1 Tax=Mycoplasma miroungigenitalium TaxID=754515 RepID=UPI001C0F7072|nr:variable surface lipoprotein [Mycoplasma miroungigenitalium]MBU4691839.1 variable surface lipoprotein [Mycoplasma miroungigenitalium]
MKKLSKLTLALSTAASLTSIPFLAASCGGEKKPNTKVVPDKPSEQSEKTDFTNKSAAFAPKESIKNKTFKELTTADLNQSNFNVTLPDNFTLKDFTSKKEEDKITIAYKLSNGNETSDVKTAEVKADQFKKELTEEEKQAIKNEDIKNELAKIEVTFELNDKLKAKTFEAVTQDELTQTNITNSVLPEGVNIVDFNATKDEDKVTISYKLSKESVTQEQAKTFVINASKFHQLTDEEKQAIKNEDIKNELAKIEVTFELNAKLKAKTFEAVTQDELTQTNITNSVLPEGVNIVDFNATKDEDKVTISYKLSKESVTQEQAKTFVINASDFHQPTDFTNINAEVKPNEEFAKESFEKITDEQLNKAANYVLTVNGYTTKFISAAKDNQGITVTYTVSKDTDESERKTAKISKDSFDSIYFRGTEINGIKLTSGQYFDIDYSKINEEEFKKYSLDTTYVVKDNSRDKLLSIKLVDTKSGETYTVPLMFNFNNNVLASISPQTFKGKTYKITEIKLVKIDKLLKYSDDIAKQTYTF